MSVDLRYISNPLAIEFRKAYILMAKYDNVGWDCVDIFMTKEETANKMKKMIANNINFADTDFVIRMVFLSDDGPVVR